jgi:DNA-binding response OmpR family regulator
MAHRLLIVEDDRSVADTVAAIARDRSWQVDVAKDGRDALARWQRRPSDLLILDLRLPGEMDGVDVFQEVRRLRGRPPSAIILTAAPEGATAAQSLGLPLLRKPFDVDELTAAMDKAVEGLGSQTSP